MRLTLFYKNKSKIELKDKSHSEFVVEPREPFLIS